MRERSGKSTRLTGVDFDKEAVNAVKDKEAEAELEEMKAEAAENYVPEEKDEAADVKAEKVEAEVKE